MCARFYLRPSVDDLLEALSAVLEDASVTLSTPRHNVAPTQQIPAVYRSELGDRLLGLFRWGLVPAWWKDAKLPTFVNARGETAASKPVFRSAFKRRRCLVPVSGFYEWTAAGKAKLPHAITVDGRDPFVLAGLWESYERGAEPVRSTTILTTDAAGPMTAVHDRMPVILPPETWADWLDPRTPVETLDALIAPRTDGLRIRRVGTGVNDVRHTDGSWFDGPVDEVASPS